jgi:hypothetical protein
LLGQTAPSPPEDSPRVSPADDHEQVLREAFELLDDGDLPAAMRAMQRAATRASPETLARLNEWVRRTRRIPLDELMAETRIRVARSSSRGKSFDIRFATPFEGPALGRRLERMTDELLKAEFGGKSVLKWARDHSEYRELRADSADLEARARTAAGVIGARLKYDPRVRPGETRSSARKPGSRENAGGPASAPSGGDSRGELIRLRDDLARLASHVRSLPGFTALSIRPDDPDDPTLREAERLQMERVEREREEAERKAAEQAQAESQPASRPDSQPASRPR